MVGSGLAGSVAVAFPDARGPRVVADVDLRPLQPARRVVDDGLDADGQRLVLEDPVDLHDERVPAERQERDGQVGDDVAVDVDVDVDVDRRRQADDRGRLAYDGLAARLELREDLVVEDLQRAEAVEQACVAREERFEER